MGVGLDIVCERRRRSSKHEVNIIKSFSSVGCRLGGGCSSRYERGTSTSLPFSSDEAELEGLWGLAMDCSRSRSTSDHVVGCWLGRVVGEETGGDTRGA